MSTQSKQMVHCHGDLTLYPSTKKAATKADKKKLHVLQASGVTGNRHEVVHKSVSIARWKDKEGKEFVSCAKPFVLQHVGGDEEHGKQEVAAGTYEIKHEFEHDPHKNELRVVLD
jgi:hypothetical protein